MTLQISRTHRRQLLVWAEEAKPQECCGLLLGHDGLVKTLQLTANVADYPMDSFEIDPSALIAAEKHSRQGGPQILGFFHSHPNGIAEPSIRDAQSAVSDGRRWVIIAAGIITSWYPMSDGHNGPITFHSEGLDEA